jgi:hypothetical protein
MEPVDMARERKLFRAREEKRRKAGIGDFRRALAVRLLAPQTGFAGYLRANTTREVLEDRAGKWYKRMSPDARTALVDLAEQIRDGVTQ